MTDIILSLLIVALAVWAARLEQQLNRLRAEARPHNTPDSALLESTVGAAYVQRIKDYADNSSRTLSYIGTNNIHRYKPIDSRLERLEDLIGRGPVPLAWRLDESDGMWTWRIDDARTILNDDPADAKIAGGTVTSRKKAVRKMEAVIWDHYRQHIIGAQFDHDIIGAGTVFDR